MRALILAASLAVLVGCDAATVPGTDAAQEDSEQATIRAMEGVDITERLPTDVRRASIIVRDMERSLEFYRDVLGMEVNYDTEVELSGSNLPVGSPGTKARLVLLNGNDPYLGWVGLLHPYDPPLEGADEPYPTRLGPGSALLVVNTDDAETTCEAATKIEGVTMTGPTRLQVYPGRDGRPDINVRGCNVFDPNGVAVEINQLLD
ncbi:VOC family protein [uncultured Erythrobacter sp.]|uniref:VOC family protein n=1 Tax=uncultured Erythrobacter sp. TaxID=263913 RepID=UPI00260ACC8C|nr:VOC family protein [uncultured Erythrobacter sp.]